MFLVVLGFPLLKAVIETGVLEGGRRGQGRCGRVNAAITNFEGLVFGVACFDGAGFALEDELPPAEGLEFGDKVDAIVAAALGEGFESGAGFGVVEIEEASVFKDEAIEFSEDEFIEVFFDFFDTGGIGTAQFEIGPVGDGDTGDFLIRRGELDEGDEGVVEALLGLCAEMNSLGVDFEGIGLGTHLGRNMPG